MATSTLTHTGGPAPASTYQPPSTIDGRLLYQPGVWGHNRPVQWVGIDVHVTGSYNMQILRDRAAQGATFGATNPVESGRTDENGNFSISLDGAFSIADTKLKFEWLYASDTFEKTILSHWSLPLGTIRVPWIPKVTIGAINGADFLHYSHFARKLSDLISKPNYPVTLALYRPFYQNPDPPPIERQLFQAFLSASPNARLALADFAITELYSAFFFGRKPTGTKVEAAKEIIENIDKTDVRILEEGSFIVWLQDILSRVFLTPIAYRDVDPMADTAAILAVVFVSAKLIMGARASVSLAFINDPVLPSHAILFSLY